MVHCTTTTWLGGMAFESTNESTNPNDSYLYIGEMSKNGSLEMGHSPKALMLSALSGCLGLDIASLIKKMKLDVDDFKIGVDATLTETHPKYYHRVTVQFYFYGKALNEKKLRKAVNLSVEKYCGVMAMFRKFSEVTTAVQCHKKSI